MKLLFETGVPHTNGIIYTKECVFEAIKKQAEAGNKIIGYHVLHQPDGTIDTIKGEQFIVASIEEHERGFIFDVMITAEITTLDPTTPIEKLRPEIRGLGFVNNEWVISDLNIISIDIAQYP